MVLFAKKTEGKLGAKRSKATLARIADVTSMFGGIESRRALEEVYSSEVSVDYTSAQQGDSSDHNIMALWASYFPGFDHARYTLSDLSLHISLQGETIVAEVRLGADRWIDDLFSEIRNNYRLRVNTTKRPLQVMNYALQALQETGDWETTSEVFVDSREHLIEMFLQSLHKGSKESLEGLIDEEAQFILHQEGGEPLVLHGQEQIIEYCLGQDKPGAALASMTNAKILPIQNADDVFVQWSGGGAFVKIRNTKIKTLQTYRT